MRCSIVTDRLANKVAIITGAGQGIGAAIARRFADEGARVVIAELNYASAREVAKTIVDHGGHALAVQTDVTQSESVARMLDHVMKEFGSPSVLVNNAGINVFSDPLETTDDDWQRCMAVDLEGVWRVTRAVLPHMLEAGRGNIINIASSHSFQIVPHCFPYPVAKHGVIGLTRALAIEFASRSVRVNAIVPGYVETPLLTEYLSTFPDPDVQRQQILNFHPTRTIAQPDEVAWTAVFLGSDEAPFMTGACLTLDGGLSVLYHAAAQ